MDVGGASGADRAAADADVSLTRELEDGEARPGVEFDELALDRLLTPATAQRLAVVAIGLLVVFWPDRTDLVLDRLVGLALVVIGAGALRPRHRLGPLRWLRVGLALLAIAVGVFLVVEPVRTATALGRVIGLAFLVKGVHDVVTLRRADPADRGWRIASASAMLAVGGFVVAFPSALLPMTVATIALAVVGSEVIAFAVIVDPKHDVTAADDTETLVRLWFADRPKTVDDRQRLYDELLYEPPLAQTRIVRFAMLMILSSVIASMGVVSDSTAVVVGAMLIAPLMTPLMAMALSLVMGWPNRLARSSLIALLGIMISISIGFVLGLIEFTIIDTTVNSQIVSRSNPTVVDLVIAVAAGAAGAYGLSRPDVSNSLPGVAIAIALVPPLTVIGISYSNGDWESGNGALLLFLTNAIAILVVGGVMFLLLGVAPVERMAENQQRVRTSVATLAGVTVLIVGALALNGTSVATNVLEQRSAQRAVQSWLEPHPRYSPIRTDVDGDKVTVVLAGPDNDEHPSAADLATELSSSLGREITVDVRIRLEVQQRATG